MPRNRHSHSITVALHLVPLTTRPHLDAYPPYRYPQSHNSFEVPKCISDRRLRREGLLWVIHARIESLVRRRRATTTGKESKKKRRTQRINHSRVQFIKRNIPLPRLNRALRRHRHS